MGRDFLIFFFLWFLPFQRTKALTIPIGAISNPTTRIGREQKVAIQLAVEKFSGVTLLANVSDLNTTDPSPVSSYVQNLVQLGAKSIIAGSTVPQAFIAGTSGEGAKVPVVSTVPSHFLSGNCLIQMSYPETSFVRCIADIVKSFNWRKVITIYEDDVFGSLSSSALLLSNALDAIGSELEYRVIFPPSDSISDPTSTVREQLNNMKSLLSTVYIVLRISETLAPILFEEAVSQGLMTKGYIWICGNDIITLLDSFFTPSFIYKYMQGLVGIRSYINDSAPEYVNFQSTFQQRFKTEYEGSGESSFDPGVYAVRAYDVVDAISLAAATSEKNNKSLVENLVATNFSGLSGLMRTTNGSLDEHERYSTFHIINVVGRSYREMGLWVDGNGFYENAEEFMLLQPSSEKLESVVFWPGGPHEPPSGLRRLKVGVPATNTIWDNFVSVEKTGNSSSYSGFCIDVFTATLSCLSYEIIYDFVPYDIDVYDELVNKVHLGEVDILVGDVTILANRSENVSFTKPYLSSGLAMLVPVEVDTKGWLPTKAFSLKLWMCISALLLYYIILVWFHERFKPPYAPAFEGSWKEQLGASLWIVSNGIFLNIDKSIRRYHTKIVITLWFFGAQLVLNSFTASLSSILVTQNLRPDVDLTKIGCDGDSFVPNYLTSVLNYSPGSIVKIYSARDYKKAFGNGTITAAYLEVPYLRVFLSQYDNYTVNGETQMLGGFGFVLPKGSLLANDMSEAILTLGENGTLRQLEKKWFPVSLSNYVAPDDDSNQSLGLSNYTYMFVISSCLAFLTVLHRCFVPPEPPANRPSDAADNAEPQPIELQHNMSQTPRRAASFPSILAPTRALVSFLSFRPYVEARCHSTASQVVASSQQAPTQEPQDQLPPSPGPPQDQLQEPRQQVALLVLPHDGPVQQGINNRQVQDAGMVVVPLHEEIHRVPEFEPAPLTRRIVEIQDPLQNRIVPHGAHNIGHQPLELYTDNVQPEMNSPRQRYRRAASSSNISMPTRLLLPFLSFRPRQIQEIEWQRLRDSAQHELENPPNSGLHNNDHQPGSSSFEQRFQSAASSSNILRTTHVRRAQSLYTQRAQENKDLQDASHDTEEQTLLNKTHEGGEPASVLRSDAEPGLGSNLRRRVSNA